MNFVHHISKGFRDIGGYTPSITHTMAHELGHGLFGLEHIFSGAYGIKKGVTYNLMDYTEKPLTMHYPTTSGPKSIDLSQVGAH